MTITLKLYLNVNGKVTVEDTEVSPGDHIDWEIGDKAISDFRIVSKRKDEKPPFERNGRLDDVYRDFHTYIITKDSKATVWEYCVEWHDTDGVENITDPKIIVNPDRIIPVL